MNILYLSKLDGRPWAGPSYSVPNQVFFQSKEDNVLWFNYINPNNINGIDNVLKWRKFDFYLDFSMTTIRNLNELPKPFNTPDLIVIEQCYPFIKDKIRHEIMSSGIPYILVPRGEFTKIAQKKHRLKKIIGNLIFGYHRFLHSAYSIQCLSDDECKNMNPYWNRNKIIIPNGVSKKEKIKDCFNKNAIRCVSIGRLEPFQKGLDLLVEACVKIRNEIENARLTIDIYGSDVENKMISVVTAIEKYNLGNIIRVHGPVFGLEKENILLGSDVFLMPSRFEGLPTSLLEAISYGLPCLASDGSNMRRVIEDSNSGWGSDTTVDGIADALINIINSVDILDKISKNALQLSELFSWDSIAQETHEKYETIMKGRRMK